jgi:hypothetical protein
MRSTTCGSIGCSKRLGRAEFGNIRAGEERLPVAGDDHGIYRTVRFGFLDRRHEALSNGMPSAFTGGLFEVTDEPSPWRLVEIGLVIGSPICLSPSARGRRIDWQARATRALAKRMRLMTKRDGIFPTFFLSGFECSTFDWGDKGRRDLNAELQHYAHADED